MVQTDNPASAVRLADLDGRERPGERESCRFFELWRGGEPAPATLQVCLVLSLALQVIRASEVRQCGVEAHGRIQVCQQVRGIELETSQTLVAENACPQGRLFTVRAGHRRITLVKCSRFLSAGRTTKSSIGSDATIPGETDFFEYTRADRLALEELNPSR